MTAWIVSQTFDATDSLILGPFVAAFIVGILSTVIAFRRHHSSIIYQIPGIVSLVPGMKAFSSFEPLFQMTSTTSPMLSLVSAAMIAFALSIGILSAKFTANFYLHG